MTELALPARRYGPAALLGIYAGLAAAAGDLRISLALAAAPLALGAAWWILLRPQRWIPVFLCAAVLLPPLPIALGDSGPHPALLVAALGGFAGLLHLGEWRLRADAISLALGLLVAALVGSVALAALYSGPAIAAGSLARVLLFGISVYLFFFVRGRPPERPWKTARLLFWAGTAAALFACLDFHWQLPAPAGYGPQFIWLASGVYRRAQGLFYEASTLGNFCAFFLTLVAVAWLRPRQELGLRRRTLAAGAALFAAALVLSYSRASVVNLAVSVTVLLCLPPRRFRLGRLAGVLTLIAAAGCAVSYYAFPGFARAYWDRLWGSAYYLFSFTGTVLSGRLESWRVLVEFLRAHPWHALAGVGYKTLPYSDFIGRRVVADNMYLSMLVETGVLGLGALLFCHAAILRAAYRAARQADARAAFFGAWILCFWAGETVQMLSGDLLTYWRVLPLYFWVLAVAAGAADERPVS
ncbi:MAG TPA: O-antigen ligase family protein [Bryobacteraceae bacterium]|nr:O-antigen ligase family protein [Bryobacteraceae bacterium]